MDDKTKDKAEEPQTGYKRITVFNSFEEAELDGLKKMASHSYEQRLSNLEALRKRSLNSANSSRLKRVITIVTPGK